MVPFARVPSAVQIGWMKYIVFALYCAIASSSSRASSSVCGPRQKCSDTTSGMSLIQVESKPRRIRSTKRITEICMMRNNSCQDMAFSRGPEVELSKENFSMATRTQIVVVRFGEDVRWLDLITEVPAILYNRGGSDALLPSHRENLKVVPSENTGREDDGFLRHIIANYDNLPEVTIFLQGWPFAHCSGLIDTIRDIIFHNGEESPLLNVSSVGGLVPLSGSFYEYGVSESKLGLARVMHDYYSGGQRGGCDGLGEAPARDAYKEMCRKILGGDCPDTHWVAEGAQWAVSRERIRLQPRSSYERALSLPEGFGGKFRGLVLEAVWPILWGGEGWSPATAKPSLLQVDMEQNIDNSGLVVRKVVAAGSDSRNYCSLDSSPSLVWSCEKRMATCELEWFKSGLAQPTSNSFVQGKGRFLTASDFDLGNGVALVARLRLPSLFGFSMHVQDDSDGNLWLRRNGSQTMWMLQFINLTEGRRGPHLFSVKVHDTDGNESVEHKYLSCDTETGLVRLATKRTTWRLNMIHDGRVLLTAVFQSRPNETEQATKPIEWDIWYKPHDDRLWCSPHKPLEATSSVACKWRDIRKADFLLDMVDRGDGI
eukprot:TRINITY_DN11367_c0_g2_i1.p1 TRINITY_DN11367_c0_g2~~TRINITY_DN11367_c0_g2_i1.p1  ORF type:complete len:599 (+),score=94.66 TRINITY_DN11367_c0_g2_i1:84-1880(+)